MNTKNAPKRRGVVLGFTLTGVLGIITILAVLATVLFPVYRGMRPLPNGSVRDGSGEHFPVPSCASGIKQAASSQRSRVTAIATSGVLISTASVTTPLTASG